MAYGSSVEPFWEVYAVHKDNPEVYELLEKYRIGNLKEEDVKKNKTEVVDPWANEPKRHEVGMLLLLLLLLLKLLFLIVLLLLLLLMLLLLLLLLMLLLL